MSIVTEIGERANQRAPGEALSSSVQRAFVILLLLYLSSCAQPQLIENSKLNEGRIPDTVKRASYASGLPVNHPLSVTLINRTELHEIFQKRLALWKQSAVWVARQAGYRAMGFLPGEWQDVYEDAALLSRSAGGLYVPEKQTLYIVGEHARSEAGGIYLNSLGDLGHQLTLTHEVIHALQHQHYPESFELSETVWQQQADASVALQAASEGDASFWAARSIGLLGRARDPEEVLAFSRDSKFEPLSDAPPLLRERMTFPYTYGYRFAYHEGKKGLMPPPASTEQIIHVKDGGRRPFLAIDLSDFGSLLETKGCRIRFQDTMGELMLSLWLRSLHSTTDQNVWEGWDGDRWIAAECDNSREVAWLTSWDTEQDAKEFESLFAVIATDFQRRADLKSALASKRDGQEVIVASGGLWPEIGDLRRLAKRARVTTRAELAAHFTKAKKAIDLSAQGPLTINEAVRTGAANSQMPGERTGASSR